MREHERGRGAECALLLLFPLILTLFLLCTVKADALCNSGAEHRFQADGVCEACGLSMAAKCADTYYPTLKGALAAASEGDTVIAFFDTLQASEHYTVKEGVTLQADGTDLCAGIENLGRIIGGRLHGRVENRGRIEGASLDGELICHERSLLLDCTLDVTANLYGGSIEGGRIIRLNATLPSGGAAFSADLRNALLDGGEMSLENRTEGDIPLSDILLPDGFSLFESAHDPQYRDILPADGTVTLVVHTHIFGDDLIYDKTAHYTACTVCLCPNTEAAVRHTLDYTDGKDGTHLAECDGCGYREALPHSGGTATCTALAECVFCHAEYGQTDHAVHASFSNGFCTACDACEIPVTVTEEMLGALGLDAAHIGYYAIENAGELLWFSSYATDRACAVLLESIALDPEEHTWVPIGRDGFFGTLDGNGRTISGLATESTNAGLIAILGEGGRVLDLGIEDASFSGSESAGGIAAVLSGGEICACYCANVTVSGGICGGIVGTASVGRIEKALSLGLVPIGSVVDAEVRDCYHSAEGEDTALAGTAYADALTLGSGEIAYRLGAPFTQNIGSDAYPRFGASPVFRIMDCDGKTAVYANSEHDRDHIPDALGLCSVCGYRYAAVCGSVLYRTLAEALSAAPAMSTVTLLSDNAEPTITVPIGVTLVGGAYRLSGQITLCGEINGGILCGTLINEGLVSAATLACTVENRENGQILNRTEGAILLGEGFAIEGTGHIDCRYHIGGSASCTEKSICLLCGTGYGTELPHALGEYTEDGNATCESDGTRTAVCTVCGAENTLPSEGTRLAHTDENADGLCDVCSAEISAQAPDDEPSDHPEAAEPPVDTDTPDENGSATLWIYAAVGLAAIVILGLVILFIIRRRRGR